MPFSKTSHRTEVLAILSSATIRGRSTQLRTSGWSNPRVLTIFGLVFLCGLTCGAALTTFIHAGFRQPASVHARLSLADLRTELRLTPDQERTVTKELDDYAKYYQNIEEQREDVAEHGKRRILSVLTPEQQKRFLEIFSFQTPLVPAHDADIQ
ncbi:MAG: hypothetical protein JO061_21020 [Acidobacteriaceae bacterium]|nr:hypothetical protein [Acidobacteriaceae bacterium]